VRHITARLPEKIDSYAYTPSNFDRLIPPLRFLCPNLSSVRLIFDSPYHSSWSVNFDQRFSITAENTGRIKVLDQHTFDLAKGPPDSLNLSPAPSTAYTIKCHLDFVFERDFGLNVPTQPEQRGLAEKWGKALITSSIFDQSYHSLDFTDIPVDVISIVAFVLRQLDLGRDYEDRLETVIAYEMSPFSMEDFRLLASVASASLTVLKLVKQDQDEEEHDDQGQHPGGEALISFLDLPDLIIIVRRDLPHLEVLHMLIGNIEQAEETCAGLLSTDFLEAGGTVNDLMLATNDCDTSLFNVIRVVSAICTSDAYISINEFGSCWWTQGDQREFLKYLRR